jgi:hypothetical protein
MAPRKTQGRAKSNARPKPDPGVVTCAELDQQLLDLSKRSILYSKPTKGIIQRRAECFLTWQSAQPGAQAVTLGPYSRWLIAARLLMTNERQRLTQLLDGPDVADVHYIFRRRFKGNHGHRTAEKYAASARKETWWPVFEIILQRLNSSYGAARERPLNLEAFLGVPVPLELPLATVGWNPITWFEQWVRWGIGIPSQNSPAKPPQTRPQPRSAESRHPLIGEVVRLSASTDRRLQHKRIINVNSHELRSAFPHFASDVIHALKDLNRGPHRGKDRPPPPIAVVYVRLSPGASRRSVLRTLYKTFGIPEDRLDNLAQRPMDLARDLDPVRKALTVNRVLLIFDAWSNVSGPFSVLHEYLCHTHWGEFLRVLAQPHLSAWRSAAAAEHFTLRYSLLVLSQHKASELHPWARFLSNPKTAGASPATPASLETVTPVATTQIPPRDSNQPTAAQINQWEQLACTSSAAGRDAAWNRLVSTLALRLVAASVNGIRRATLHRCLDYWYSQFWAGRIAEPRWKPQTHMEQQIKQLVSLPDLLDEIDEEELESLPAHLRSVELNRRPTLVEDPEKVLAFKSSVLRSSFVSALIDDEAHTTSKTTCSWSHVNFLLAEECLRQGTSQLRHLSTDSMESPYASRRVVQAIYHGLLSLEVTVFSPDVTSHGELYGTMLPVDGNKRYRYLYSFLYRNIVESGVWKLGRAFGRPDLRVDLLKLFIQPRLGIEMLAGPGTPLSGSDLPAERDLGKLPAPLRDDSALWSDLLEALGRSGCDLGGDSGRAAARWALNLLPRGTDSAYVHALLRGRTQGTVHYKIVTETLKLRVDWLRSEGQLEKAKQLLLAEFRQLGVPESVFEDLSTRMRGIVDLLLTRPVANGQPQYEVRTQLQEALNTALEAFSSKIRHAEQRENASTLIFRMADLLSIEAQDSMVHESRAERRRHRRSNRTPAQIASDARNRAYALSHACATYWIADRLRSKAGGMESVGVEWPRVGARSMRSYVRACLQLARLLTEAAAAVETPRLQHMTGGLLEHAQQRISVYTRHHFQFRRERVSILMLEAHRIRTWVEIDMTRNASAIRAHRNNYWRRLDHRGTPLSLRNARTELTDRLERIKGFLDNNWRLLMTSWDLLRESDAHLLALGFQAAYVRRPYLEKIETATAFVELLERYAMMAVDWPAINDEFNPKIRLTGPYLDLAQNLLAALRETAGRNYFWCATAAAQTEKLQHAKTIWNEMAIRQGVTPVSPALPAAP